MSSIFASEEHRRTTALLAVCALGTAIAVGGFLLVETPSDWVTPFIEWLHDKLFPPARPEAPEAPVSLNHHGTPSMLNRPASTHAAEDVPPLYAVHADPAHDLTQRSNLPADNVLQSLSSTPLLGVQPLTMPTTTPSLAAAAGESFPRPPSLTSPTLDGGTSTGAGVGGSGVILHATVDATVAPADPLPATSKLESGAATPVTVTDDPQVSATLEAGTSDGATLEAHPDATPARTSGEAALAAEAQVEGTTIQASAETSTGLSGTEADIPLTADVETLSTKATVDSDASAGTTTDLAVKVDAATPPADPLPAGYADLETAATVDAETGETHLAAGAETSGVSTGADATLAVAEPTAETTLTATTPEVGPLSAHADAALATEPTAGEATLDAEAHVGLTQTGAPAEATADLSGGEADLSLGTGTGGVVTGTEVGADSATGSVSLETGVATDDTLIAAADAGASLTPEPRVGTTVDAELPEAGLVPEAHGEATLTTEPVTGETAFDAEAHAEEVSVEATGSASPEETPLESEATVDDTTVSVDGSAAIDPAGGDASVDSDAAVTDDSTTTGETTSSLNDLSTSSETTAAGSDAGATLDETTVDGDVSLSTSTETLGAPLAAETDTLNEAATADDGGPVVI